MLVAASLLHRFDASKGVEILPGLQNAALDLLAKWRVARDRLAQRQAAAVALKCAWSEGDCVGVACESSLGDALTPVGTRSAAGLEAVDWSDGDLVLCNSVLFNDAMLLGLAQQARAPACLR